MVLPFFAITLFVSAFCLFLVQPIIGKLILPKLGGTPQVWNTCMVFFQTALLAGYGYTHTVSTRLNLRQQLIVHSFLLFIPLLILLPVPYTSFPGSTGPFTFPEWTPPLGGNPIPQTLLLLAWIVGIPFLVIATSAPLLQKWFSTTGHPAAKDPYFLYGASNLGSLLALLLYPVAVEPWLNLSSQSWLFFSGYLLLMTLVLGCVAVVWQSSAKFIPLVDPLRPAPSPATPAEAAIAPAPTSSSTATTATPPAPAPANPAPPPARTAPAGPGAKTTPAGPSTAVKKGAPKPGAKQPHVKPSHAPGELSIKSDEMTLARRLRWIVLAAVPSSFMLGVTSHITTDLSPMPLFWLVPLSLYLLSFILVYSKWPVVWVEKPHQIVLYAQAILIPVMIWCELTLGADQGSSSLWTIVSFNILAFFATALMCHGELAKDRPGTQHLTEYFLLMSVGGMLGGMFNGLVAPVFFFGLAEFPIAVFLACLVRPMMKEDGWIDTWLTNMLEPHPTRAAAAKPAKPGQAPPPEKATSYAPLLDVALPLIVLGLGFGITMFFVPNPAQARARDLTQARWIGFGIPLLVACFYFGRPVRLALAVGGVLLLQVMFEARMEYSRDATTLVRDRSYFGIIRVKQAKQPIVTPEKKGEFTYTQLVHGHILHGQNFMVPEDPKDLNNPYRDFSRIATTYYHRRGPAGVVMEKFNWFHEYTADKSDFKDYNMYQSDARICASIVGINALIGGGFPMDTIVDGWSEPPFATIGLGTGTMASYGRPFQYVHYYEIDDHIKRLSQPGKKDKKFPSTTEFPNGVPLFNYLFMAERRGCNVEVLMGDARLRMALPYNLMQVTTTKGASYRGLITKDDDKEVVIEDSLKRLHTIPADQVKTKGRDKSFAGGPDKFYHMMVVDAFSSDAIPAHLITKQAIELYFTKLAPQGILCVHTSNRFVNLPLVVAAVAQDLDLAYKTGHDRGYDNPADNPQQREERDYSIKNVGRSSSEWVMVAKTSDDLKSLNAPPGYNEADMLYWRVFPGAEKRYLWTDDHYNLLTILRIFDKSSR